MNVWFHDLRYAFRMLRKNVVLTACSVAGHWNRRQPPSSAWWMRCCSSRCPIRSRTVWRCCGCVPPASAFPRTGRRRGNTSTFRRKIIPLRRCRFHTGPLDAHGPERPEWIEASAPRRACSTCWGRSRSWARPPAGGGCAWPGAGGHTQLPVVAAPVQRRPGIVGKSVTLNGQPYVVAGVLRPDFLLDPEVMPSRKHG